MLVSTLFFCYTPFGSSCTNFPKYCNVNETTLKDKDIYTCSVCLTSVKVLYVGAQDQLAAAQLVFRGETVEPEWRFVCKIG